jgi:hypothetical protein
MILEIGLSSTKLEQNGVLGSQYCYLFVPYLFMTLGFQEKRHFFPPKIGKNRQK